MMPTPDYWPLRRVVEEEAEKQMTPGGGRRTREREGVRGLNPIVSWAEAMQGVQDLAKRMTEERKADILSRYERELRILESVRACAIHNCGPKGK